MSSRYTTSEQIDEAIVKLQEQKKELQKKEKKQAVDFRRHALVVAGYAIENACGDSWANIDMPAFYEWVLNHSSEIAAACQKAETTLVEDFRLVKTFELQNLSSDVRQSIYKADAPVAIPKARKKKAEVKEDPPADVSINTIDDASTTQNVSNTEEQ